MLPKKQRYTLYALLLISISVLGTTAIANSKVLTLFENVSTVLKKVVVIPAPTTPVTQTKFQNRSEAKLATSAMFATIIQGADEEVGCSVQGFTVARFNLCGDYDDRIISLAGSYGSVSWQVLGGSCSPNINDDCPNTGSCYTQVATGPTFTLDANAIPATSGAEYRVVADGQTYYFKVKKSTITQTYQKQDFICGVEGRIQITNLSSAYEYSIDSGSGFGPWQGPIFSNLAAGTYNVKARLRNTPNTCEYPYEPITIQQLDIEIEATFVDALCNGDTGSVTVTASNVPGPYKYTLLNSSGVAQEFTAFISDNPYTFSAVGFGTYTVQVETQQCTGDPLNGINPPRQNLDTSGNPITIGAGASALDASTEVNSSFGCSDISSVDITLNASGGSAPYTYTVNGGPVQPAFGNATTDSGTTTYTVTSDGTYDFVITDSNGCIINASSDVETLLPPDVSVAGIDGTCSNGGAKLDFTINNGRGYNISYRESGSAAWVNTPQISVAAGTYNAIEVRYQQGGFECTLNLPTVTVTTVGSLTGSAAKVSDVTCTTGGTNGGQIDFSGPFTGGSGSGYVFSIDGVNFTTTTSYTDLAAGIYSPIIRDAGGCRLELTSIEIFDVDPPTNLDFIQSTLSCLAGTVDVELNPTSNAAIDTYEIISPIPQDNGSINLFSGLSNNTNYTFRITDANGCTYEESFTPSIVSTIRVRVKSGGDLRVCPSGNDGEATFLVDGFANSYSYEINPGAIIGSGQTSLEVPVTGLAAGTYTVTITDDDTDCTDTTSVTIVEPTTPLTLGSNVTAMSCQNNNIGRVEALASGGYGSYRYELDWPTGSGVSTQGPKSGRFFGNLVAEGTYTLRVIDAEGCTAETTFTLSEVDPPAIDLDVVDYCYSPSSNASLTVTSTAGTALIGSHEFRINGGALQPTGTFTGLVPGNYTIEVVDGNNCTDQLSVTIPPQVQINLNLITEIPCGGTGEMGINVSGGNTSVLAATSYTVYLDGNPVSGATGLALPSNSFNYTIPLNGDGVYTVEVTDSNGCTNISPPLTFSPPSNIVATADAVGPSCGDPNSGFVEILPDVSFGTPPFQVVFAPVGTGLVDSPFNPDPSNTYSYSSQTIYSGLTAGDYEYIVKDARNCTTGVQTVTVSQDITNPPDATVTAIDALCSPTGVSGGIQIDVVDGRPNYIIIIEDNFGNEIVRRENVSAADLPLSIVDPSLVEGNYTVITLDSRGCLDMDGVSINSIDLQIVPDFDVPDDCVDGIIPQCVDIVNGVGPFDIRMVTDPSSPYIDLGATGRRHCFDFVPGGTYTVEVLDEGTGCVYQETVTVPEENSPVDVQLAIDNGNCNGEDVALEYAIIGAPGPFDIVIRNTDTGAIITDVTNTPVANDIFLVPQGPYSITVIDNTNFCTGADFIEATLNMPRVDVINNENANCNELGQLTVRGSGGTPFPPTGAGSLTDGSPYEFAFVPAGNSPASGDYGTATTIYLPGSLGGTSYDIWVRDSRGCEYMTSATIVQLDPDLPEPSIDVNNQCDGTIPVGGFQIELTMPANVVNPTFTLGGQTLTPAYDSSTPTVAVFNVGSGIGVYDVYVVDANGCDVSTTAEVYQILSASGGFSTDPTCEDADGTITITANGGSGDFSFELTGVDFNGNPITPIVQANDEVYNGFASTTTEQFVNIAPGTYEVEVTDNRVFGSGVNCTTTVSSIIAATPVQPVIADTGETNVSCNGAGDGSISVSLSTGTDADGIQEFNLYSATIPLTGAETPLSTNTSGSFDNLNPGIYVVEVVSNKLCNDVSQVTIAEPPVFEITSNDENLLCESGVNRLSTATISAQIVSPGNGGSYGYRLDPNDSYQNSPDFDIVDIGSDQTITIYAIDSNGCEDMVTITVYAPTDVIPTVSTLSALNCANPEQVEITASGTSDFTVITTGPSGTIIPNAVVTGGGTALIDLPEVGDYFFEVQDDSPNGCVYPLPRYTVNAPILPTATITEAKPVSCFGTDDGELFIDVTDYSGNYNYRVFEASDVSKSNPIVIGSFDTANFSTTNLARITGLPGGNLYVEVIATDSPFCSNDSNVANIRTPNGPLQVDAISIGNVGCTNDTGEIEATGSGGWDAFPYEYRLLLSTDGGTSYTSEIAAFSTNNSFTGLSFGFYQVEIRDSELCSNTFEIELEEVPQIVAGIREPQGLDCPNGNNAVLEAYDTTSGDFLTATAGASGGFPGAGYNYTLLYLNSDDNTDIISQSGLQNTPTFIGDSGGFISEGWFAIEVSSSFGCSYVTEPYYVIPPPPVQPLLVQTRVPGCGGDGEMRLSIENPDPLFTYEFAPVENGVVIGSYQPLTGTSILISGVQGITYQFDVRKVNTINTCPAIRSNGITMTNATGITLLPNLPDDISCASELDGRIESFVNGGVGQDVFYLFEGDPVDAFNPVSTATMVRGPQDNGTFEGLPEGTQYYIAVTSGATCMDIAGPFEIVRPDPIIFEADATNVTCNGEEDGSITVSVTAGGVGLIQFAIAPNFNEFFSDPNNPGTYVFEDLAAGTYEILIQDENGCFEKDFITVEEPEELQIINISTTPELCIGANNGTAQFEISGGTPFNDLTIASTPYFEYKVEMIDPIDETGTAVFAPYTGGITQDLQGGASYAIYVQDANLCSTMEIFTINIGVDLAAEALVTYGCDGIFPTNTTRIDLQDDSLLPQLMFALDPLDPTDAITAMATEEYVWGDLPAGNHIVYVYHENGCTTSVEFAIDNYDPLILSVDKTGPNEIVATATGGFGGYEYFFNGNSYGSDNVYTTTRSETIEVKVVDAQGCMLEFSVPFEFTGMLEFPNFFTPDGDNLNDEWSPKNRDLFEGVDVKIYDRYGRIVAILTEVSGWDGTYEGKEVPTGDYWYVVNANSNKIRYVGHFTLYR